jgi:hypothetical protein
VNRFRSDVEAGDGFECILRNQVLGDDGEDGRGKLRSFLVGRREFMIRESLDVNVAERKSLLHQETPNPLERSSNCPSVAFASTPSHVSFRVSWAYCFESFGASGDGAAKVPCMFS